ncbi:hypothetical protein AOLI_G00240860 [Acnodon oligacanthus]
MEGEFMETMRTLTEFLDGKFSFTDELKIQLAWNILQDDIKHLNQLLLTERMDRQRDREQAERLSLEKEQWMAKEASLMSQVQQLRTELALRDWQLDRARKMEETSRKRAEKLKDREIQEKQEGGAPKNSKNTWTWMTCMTKSAEGLKVNDELQNELLMKDEELEKMRRKLIEGQKKVKKIQNMSDELRSKNMEVSAKYMAMMKEKMKEREQEIIRDSTAAIKESEDRILSTVSLVVIKKHRLMQELQKRVNTKNKAMMKEKMEELEHEWDIRDPIAAIKESEDWILSVVTLVVIKKHRLMHELQKRVSRSQSDNMSKKKDKRRQESLKCKMVEEKQRKEALMDEKEKTERASGKLFGVVNAKYKAMMKEKMEELERQREIRDPVAAIKEDRILSVVTLVVISKGKERMSFWKTLLVFSI